MNERSSTVRRLISLLNELNYWVITVIDPSSILHQESYDQSDVHANTVLNSIFHLIELSRSTFTDSTLLDILNTLDIIGYANEIDHNQIRYLITNKGKILLDKWP